MKIYIVIILLFSIIATSCQSDDQELIVMGSVKGLKKGTLYLQKQQDTLFVSVDSTNISGESNFILKTFVEEPEVFYLVLDKNDSNEGRITFFADKGVTEIHTTLKNFAYDAKITGSPQQKLLQEYRTMNSRYQNKNLDIIKENFEAIQANDSIKAFETDYAYKSLLKSKYLYTINFAINNKTSQVAPYLALTEIYDAQLKYLDTIYNSLPDSISVSKYGKELKTFIDKRKSSEIN